MGVLRLRVGDALHVCAGLRLLRAGCDAELPRDSELSSVEFVNRRAGHPASDLGELARARRVRVPGPGGVRQRIQHVLRQA